MSGLAVYGFSEDQGPVTRLAGALGGTVGQIDLKTFPDGETLPTAPLTGARTVILYRSLHQPNTRLIPLLQAADACRRAGATRLVLVAPYLCYLRQDKVFAPGQPLSRDVIGPMLGQAFDRIVTVQAHLHRTSSLEAVLGAPADNLDIGGDLAALASDERRPLIVGPDSESEAWVRTAAGRLGLDWAVFDKQRLGDREVLLMLKTAIPIAGRDVLLLDDICSSGGTLEQACRHLLAAVFLHLVHRILEAVVPVDHLGERLAADGRIGAERLLLESLEPRSIRLHGRNGLGRRSIESRGQAGVPLLDAVGQLLEDGRASLGGLDGHIHPDGHRVVGAGADGVEERRYRLHAGDHGLGDIPSAFSSSLFFFSSA